MSVKSFMQVKLYVSRWKWLSIFMLPLCVYACGGGAAEVASAPIETTPVTHLVVHNNYEGVWKERCTEDPYIRVGNYIGPPAYRLRTDRKSVV